jgi:hypothetical protein
MRSELSRDEKMRLDGDITSDHFGEFKKRFDVRADEHVRRFRFPMPLYYRWLIVEKVRNWDFVCLGILWCEAAEVGWHAPHETGDSKIATRDSGLVSASNWRKIPGFRSPHARVLGKAPESGAFSRRPEIPGLAGVRGWGGRIRTSVWRNQNPLPYRLATPQSTPRSASAARRTIIGAPLTRNPAAKPRAFTAYAVPPPRSGA